MEQSDKVSKVLEQYLRHRFSDERVSQYKKAKSQEQSQPATTAINKQNNQNNSSLFCSPGPSSIVSSNHSNFSNTTLESNNHKPPTTLSSRTLNMVDISPPSVSHFVAQKKRPSCAAVRDDLKYVALGFETSNITLHTINLNSDNASLSVIATKELIAHHGPIYSVKFLPEDHMLSSSEDITIRLWCLETFTNTFVYMGHIYPVWSLEISPQHNMFAASALNKSCRLWMFDKKWPVRILFGHDDDVECMAFHPNEKYLATGSRDHTIRLWNIDDGRVVRVMVGHQNTVRNIGFLPDGKFLTSASIDGAIKVWDLATNNIIQEISTPSLSSISFNFSSNLIASCLKDGSFRLWLFRNHKIERILKELPPNDYFQVGFSKKHNIVIAFSLINPNIMQGL